MDKAKLHKTGGKKPARRSADGKSSPPRQKRPHYAMAALPAQSGCAQKRTNEEQEWLNAPAVGKELL